MRRQQHGLDLKEGGSRLGIRPNSLGACFLSLVSWSEGISIGAIVTFPSRCEQRHYTANVQARSNAARSPRSSTEREGDTPTPGLSSSATLMALAHFVGTTTRRATSRRRPGSAAINLVMYAASCRKQPRAVNGCFRLTKCVRRLQGNRFWTDLNSFGVKHVFSTKVPLRNHLTRP